MVSLAGAAPAALAALAGAASAASARAAASAGAAGVGESSLTKSTIGGPWAWPPYRPSGRLLRQQVHLPRPRASQARGPEAQAADWPLGPDCQLPGSRAGPSRGGLATAGRPEPCPKLRWHAAPHGHMRHHGGLRAARAGRHHRRDARPLAGAGRPRAAGPGKPVMALTHPCPNARHLPPPVLLPHLRPPELPPHLRVARGPPQPLPAGSPR